MAPTAATATTAARSEKRTIDKRTYYDWPNTWDLVRCLAARRRDLQRRRSGRALGGQRTRHRRRPLLGGLRPGGRRMAVRRRPAMCATSDSPTGTRDGSKWLPAECDVSIRPGWFWRESENARRQDARRS